MKYQNQPSRCPFCGGDLVPGAMKCRHCGEWVVPSDQRVDESIYYDHLQGGGGERPQGFFEAYFVEPFITRFADYTGYTPRKDFWLSTLALLIINFAYAGIVMAIEAMIQTYWVTVALWIVMGVFNLSWIALAVRRIADAGYPRWYALALIVPIIGQLLILLLCAMPSRGAHSRRAVRFGGADFVILILSVLLYTGGLIMFYEPFGSGEAVMNESDSVYSDTIDLFEEDEQAEVVRPQEEVAAPKADTTQHKEPAKVAAPAATDSTGAAQSSENIW